MYDFLWVFLQSWSNWFWHEVSASSPPPPPPTHTHCTVTCKKNSACIILHEFKVSSRLNLVLYPHNMCSWVQTVCQPGLSRHVLLFSTVLHEMVLRTYILNDYWCHAGVTSWTLYHRITVLSAHVVTCMVHCVWGPSLWQGVCIGAKASMSLLWGLLSSTF